MFSDELMVLVVLALVVGVGAIELVRRWLQHRKWKRAAWHRE
jgi:hypothetical protein